MTKRVIAGFLIACSVILNVVFIGMWIAHAAPRHFAQHSWCVSMENAHHGYALPKTLSMSDSQWTIMQPGIESLREKMSGICGDILKNRAELLNELEKTPTDSVALSACRERIVACQKKMQVLVTDHILKEKEMLTQDQRQRYFNALRKNMTCAGVPEIGGMMSCKHRK